MRLAGAQRIYFIVRPGKFDIAEYYGDGSRLGLTFAYLMMGAPYGPPFSVAQAAPSSAIQWSCSGSPISSPSLTTP